MSQDTDLVPTADGSGRLRIGLVPAAVRLRDAEPGNGSGIHLVLSDTGPSAPGTDIHLRTAAGIRRTTATTVAGELRLELPESLGPQESECELWYRTPRGEGRVRAHADLCTTRVATLDLAGVSGEVVVRPTRHGYAVVETRASRLDMRALEEGHTPEVVVARGGGSPVDAGARALELHCTWTGGRVTFPVEPERKGWRAVLHVGSLDTGPAAGACPWSVAAVDRHGQGLPLEVPVETRSRLPLSAGSASGPVQLALGDADTPTVSVGEPGTAPRWPKLRRIQHSNSGA